MNPTKVKHNRSVKLVMITTINKKKMKNIKTKIGKFLITSRVFIASLVHSAAITQ